VALQAISPGVPSRRAGRCDAERQLRRRRPLQLPLAVARAGQPACTPGFASARCCVSAAASSAAP
jgi:hypothetical protein